jgi:hypothetical protein
MSIKPVADAGLAPGVKATLVLCQDSASLVDDDRPPFDKID